MKYTTLLLLLIASLTFSQTVTQKEAKTVAKNYYFNKTSQYSDINKKDIKIKSTTKVANLFIINLKTKGYIITSSNKNITPILAYSNESNFDFNNIPPAVNFWLNRYKEQSEYIINSKAKSSENNFLWEKCINNLNTKEINDTLIEPLISSKWNQTTYYNALCPIDSAGPDNRTLTGCVATSVAQIMYYHRFPESGTGSYSYDCPNIGIISEDFSTANYNYNEMSDVLSDYSYSAALLLYHVGVTFDMHYGPDGSGVWNHSVDASIKTHFKYCPETEYIFRDSTNLNWDSIVYVNIVNNKPLYYAGWEDMSFQSGHAFVCDGYQGANYYHYNWGWGGAYDGWFYSNNLTPGGSQFSYAQEIIKDIYPDTLNYTYPKFCTEHDTLKTTIGAFTDGSSALNYENNANCTWYINPECSRIINMKFDQFDVKHDDTLFVYNGANENSTLLAYYTEGEEPILSSQYNATEFISNAGEMFLKFTSNDTITSSGWKTSYLSEPCSYGLNITDTIGSISDGSEECNYKSGLYCKWEIEPNNTEAILINFTQFQLDSTNISDYVKIYKNSSSSANLIADYRSTDTPSTLFVPAGKVVVKFLTNSNSSGQGWALDYEKTLLSNITDNVSNTFYKIFPNPINNTTVLEFVNITSKNGTIKIFDISGKLLGHKKLSLINGLNTIQINTIVKLQNKGIYFLKYYSNSNTFTEKVAIK